jgi:hypothetical protein
MPFDPAFPRPFLASEVRAHVPAVSGVFGISNAGEWIYIGETANLQAALLSLLQRPNTRLPQQIPTGFVFEICDTANRPARQQCLVREYRPSGNVAGSDQRQGASQR